MSQLLEKIYQEIKSLRHDLVKVLPFESLVEYGNAKSIVASYKRALKKYPNQATEDGDY
ncbi:MAG: hypothetical protein HY481_00440 [Candidatus Vogelbacteria bacterium]|nr:hypothetical protein [Candidatus Vogelbacteria bacterium]